jgi:L-alanine-DL-glutamate epimerase-like enolase superfamily enzyme
METDIRVLKVNIYFQEIHMRTALLFGRKMAAGARPLPVTLLTARILAENRAGKRGEGWGSMLLSPNWAFPSDIIDQETRDRSMREVARRYAQFLSGWKEFAHPLIIALDTKADLLRLAREVSVEMALPEPLPALAALNAGSPMDCALHDAFGLAAGIDSYAGYGPDHCSFDLSRWLGAGYRGRHVSDYLSPKFAPTVPVFHLVGGGDKLTRGELDDSDPQDGLPVSLDQWIEREGMYCFKVKLKGTDLTWDVGRVVAVSRVVEEEVAKQGQRDYYMSVDSNEMCPDPEYVVDMLEQIRAQAARAYGALLYVEQPTERDLTRHRFDMAEIARRKPVLADEGIASFEDIDLARELGWSGIALKTCKGLSSALLTVAKARQEGLLYSVQDLTNPGLALLQSVGFAARIQPLKGVEANARQYIPAASAREAAVHPHICQVTNGEVSTESLRWAGLGFRVEELAPFTTE